MTLPEPKNRPACPPMKPPAAPEEVLRYKGLEVVVWAVPGKYGKAARHVEVFRVYLHEGQEKRDRAVPVAALLDLTYLLGIVHSRVAAEDVQIVVQRRPDLPGEIEEPKKGASDGPHEQQ